jgi:hypothetical protein
LVHRSARRDERGKFRAFDIAASIERRDVARKELTARIERAVATSATTFPQGD